MAPSIKGIVQKSSSTDELWCNKLMTGEIEAHAIALVAAYFKGTTLSCCNGTSFTREDRASVNMDENIDTMLNVAANLGVFRTDICAL